MVFQTYTSFAWLTVRENVEYGLKLHGVSRQPNGEAQAENIWTQVGLEELGRRNIRKELSGGMKQRVAIARTLINKPKLLLMDEPFGALDPQTRWGMQGLLIDISRKEDNTILFVTHDVTEAVYLADTVIRALQAAGADAPPGRGAALRRARSRRSSPRPNFATSSSTCSTCCIARAPRATKKRSRAGQVDERQD